MKPATLDAYRLLHDGVLELSRIEANGVRVDVAKLNDNIEKTKRRIKKTEAKLTGGKVWKTWCKVYGDKSNFLSDEQMGDIIFNKLGHEYPTDERTSTGRYKMDEKTLDLLNIPFIKTFQKYKKLVKATDFLYGIKKELVDDRVHMVQNLHIARTYRSTQSNPNGQQWPSRDKMQSEIVRSNMIPDKDHVLIEIDYGTLEVKIGYCYHHDKTMFKYLMEKNPDGSQKNDMHRDAAAKIFQCKPELVSKEMRFYGKNQFVFAEFYGSFFAQCAPPLWLSVDRAPLVMTNGVSVRDHLSKLGYKHLGECKAKREGDRPNPKQGTFAYHMKEVEDWLWQENFKGYARWRKEFFNQYLEKGYFRNLTGFVFDGIQKRNNVTNYPVQSSAFHCLLWSLIELNRWLRKNKMRSMIINQIHDSLLASVHKNEVEDFIAQAIQITTVDLLKHWKWIIIPLNVEVEIAEDNWYDKKPYEVMPI